MAIGAVSWPQSRPPNYKDWLACTLGITFEAMGVELLRGKPALMLPLALGLIFALLVRFLPENVDSLKWMAGSKMILQGKTVSRLLFMMYFFIGMMVLLLAYKGWWDIILINPAND
jgi:hypothetical protein